VLEFRPSPAKQRRNGLRGSCTTVGAGDIAGGRLDSQPPGLPEKGCRRMLRLRDSGVDNT